MIQGFSTNGNALNDDLEHHEIGLRQINRASEWSGPERLQICMMPSIRSWGILNPSRPQIDSLDLARLASGLRPAYLSQSAKQEQQIFDTIVVTTPHRCGKTM